MSAPADTVPTGAAASASAAAVAAPTHPASTGATGPAGTTSAAPGPWFVSPIPPVLPSGVFPLCAPDDEVQIHYLADVPHMAAHVARALFAEWPDVYTNYLGIQTLAGVEADMINNYSHRTQLGLVVVATVNGEFACTGTLTTEDAPGGHPYHGVKPWITCMWVEPAFRRRGIATKVFMGLARLAQHWGYQHVWLITEDSQKMYEAHGWKRIEDVLCWAPRVFTVMRKDFHPETIQPAAAAAHAAAAAAAAAKSS
jgi:GNAT superfamily N-acetyltransferase